MGSFQTGQSQPFHATIDYQGRLIKFVIASSGGSPDTSLGYSDFGAHIDVTRPENAVPAPDALYPQLGLSD